MAMTASRESTTPLYVYAVTWSGAAGRRRGAGVAGADVDVVEHGELAAVVSALPEGSVRAKRRDLMRHMDVVKHAFEQQTVVPLQFGSVFPGRDVLIEELLVGRYEELVELLQRLEGLVEVRVRATYDQEAILAEIVQGDPRIERMRERTQAGGRDADGLQIQLGEAVARSLAAAQERDRRAIATALGTHARDAVHEDPRTEYELLRSSYLVDRGSLDAFDRTMDELARSHRGRVAFNYIGPLAPHSFVALPGRNR